MVHPCLADVASSVITSRLYRQKNLFPANFRRQRRFPHDREHRIKDLLNVYRAAAGIRARSISGELHTQTPISARPGASHQRPAQCVQGCGRNSSSIYFRRIAHANADFRTPGSIASKTCSMCTGLRQEFELDLFPANFRRQRRFPHRTRCQKQRPGLMRTHLHMHRRLALRHRARRNLQRQASSVFGDELIAKQGI
jgi:hypothetical protein